MLTAEDNELLTRVGPGTPMGETLRHYWLPAFFGWEVEADGRPLRVRLLGEDLIAFRATDGRIGVVANNCPHRGASLFFGRNEEEGLRCVYHGWKFDLTGRCVDMPNEPAESNFKVRVQECNWAQAVEGGIDSSHISFLHSRMESWRRPEAGATSQAQGVPYSGTDRHPRFEVVDTPSGILIGARRNAEEGKYYWRITQCLMPFYTLIPGSLDPAANISGHAWVPMDDERTLTYSMTWNERHPLKPEEIERMQSYPGGGIHYGRAGMKPETTQPGGKFVPALCRENDYGLDYELQATKLFFGIEQFGTQDSAIQETMGTIFDRSQEHLGAADTAVIRFRRRLIDAAKAWRAQQTIPPGVETPAAYAVRSASITLPRDESWLEASREALVPSYAAR
jgi:phthalate 4,5-dioxygenase oxygenase subunit